MALTVDTFYFNGTVTDPDSNWSNDANVTDGDTGTGATAAAISTSGSKYLEIDGTSATTILDTIVTVRVRIYSAIVTAAYVSADNFSTDLTAGATFSGSPSAYRTLLVPSGGWTFAALRDLKVKLFSGATTPTVNHVQLEVTHGTVYTWPIMVGSQVALGTSTSDRYSPLAATNDAGITSSVNNDTIMPVAGYFTNYKFVTATAAGASASRIETLKIDDAATALAISLADPATSGTDSDVVSFAALQTANFDQTGSGTLTDSATSRWRINQIGENQIIFSTSSGLLSTSANRFMGIQDSGGLATTAAAVTQYFPEAGTIKNYTFKIASAIASGSYAVDVFINGISVSSQTIDSSNQVVQDTTSDNIAQGDTGYIQVVPSSPANARSLWGGMEYVSNTAGNYILLSNNNTNTSNSANRFNNWYGTGAWNATEGNVQALGYATTVVGLYAVVSADTGGGKTRTLTFRDGGDTSAQVVFNNSGTTKSWTGSVSVATDDLICMGHVPSGSPTAATVKYGLVLRATQIPNQPIGKQFFIKQAVNRSGTY